MPVEPAALPERHMVKFSGGALLGYLLATCIGAIIFTILAANILPTRWWQGMIVGALIGLMEYAVSPGKFKITLEYDADEPTRRMESYERSRVKIQAWLTHRVTSFRKS